MNPASPPAGDQQDMPQAAILLDELCKTYSDGTKAVDRVSLTVNRGTIFGLLGPNGAGKSTIINILAGIVKKTSGRVMVAGYDIDHHSLLVRSRIGIVPQETNFDPFFTPVETLEMQAGYFGVRKRDRQTDKLLEVMGLTDKAHASARSLSGGMRRRLMVAKALVHSPPILVLDEPTAGVDVELRKKLWSYVTQLRDEGVTIILTTHYLYEAQELCDTLAIVDKGKIIALDRKDALLSRLGTKKLVIGLSDPLTVVPQELKLPGLSLDQEGRLVMAYGREGGPSMGDLLKRIQAAGLLIVDVKTSETSLEDIFVELTREGSSGDQARAREVDSAA